MGNELKEKSIKVSRLIEIDEEQNYPMGLEIIAGLSGMDRSFNSTDINRPGLSLTGFFDYFASGRVQVFGRGETAYIEKLISEGDTENIERFFQYDIPVCVITHGRSVHKYVLDLAENMNIPILRTKLSTESFISFVKAMLDEFFAPFEVFHGEFVSIHNIGVLIIGPSGIGKSECVLGLVERGHKFVCDDMVKVKKMRTPRGYELKGQPYVDYGSYIEIRGIGIINVSQYYGEGKILEEERLGLVISLMEWKSDYNYDRLGIEEKYMTILDIKVPLKEIPVSSGRNVPLLIEVAAYREIMRRLGYNSAEELEKKVLNFMRKEKGLI